MPSDIRTEPISTIARMLREANPSEEECLLSLLKGDPRKGAQSLLETHRRKRARSDEARRRLEAAQRFERELKLRGFRTIAGVDEVGRGALAGPIVAAAVVLPEDCGLDIRDSKEIPPRRREALFEAIIVTAVAWATAEISSGEIDALGMSEANRLALLRAAEALPVAPEYLLSDAFPLEGSRAPSIALVKGDKVSLSVGAASIVAKVTRDRLMTRYHRQFPRYGFDRNKGYGTAVHLEALRRIGPSPIHRRSFSWS